MTSMISGWDIGGAHIKAAVVDEMNRDHADALIDYCKGLRGTTPARAEMVAIEAAGFFVRTHEPDDLLYFPFGEEIDAKRVRDEFVELLERARKQQGSARRFRRSTTR